MIKKIILRSGDVRYLIWKDNFKKIDQKLREVLKELEVGPESIEEVAQHEIYHFKAATELGYSAYYRITKLDILNLIKAETVIDLRGREINLVDLEKFLLAPPVPSDTDFLELERVRRHCEKRK